MTDPAKKIYNSIQEGLLDVARLGVKNYEKIKNSEIKTNEKLSILTLKQIIRFFLTSERSIFKPKLAYSNFPIKNGEFRFI